MKKVTENIDDEAKHKERKTTETDSEGMEDEEEEGSEKKKGKKGKNTKIPIEQSWKLTQWLMQNFSYPYPTTQAK